MSGSSNTSSFDSSTASLALELTNGGMGSGNEAAYLKVANAFEAIATFIIKDCFTFFMKTRLSLLLLMLLFLPAPSYAIVSPEMVRSNVVVETVINGQPAQGYYTTVILGGYYFFATAYPSNWNDNTSYAYIGILKEMIEINFNSMTRDEQRSWCNEKYQEYYNKGADMRILIQRCPDMGWESSSLNRSISSCVFDKKTCDTLLFLITNVTIQLPNGNSDPIIFNSADRKVCSEKCTYQTYLNYFKIAAYNPQTEHLVVSDAVNINGDVLFDVSDGSIEDVTPFSKTPFGSRLLKMIQYLLLGYSIKIIVAAICLLLLWPFIRRYDLGVLKALAIASLITVPFTSVFVFFVMAGLFSFSAIIILSMIFESWFVMRKNRDRMLRIQKYLFIAMVILANLIGAYAYLGYIFRQYITY